MNRSSAFRLVGLEPDNLLAFLALLGTMRAVDTARPLWNAGVIWSGAPWRPEITVTDRVDEAAFLEAVGEGATSLVSVYDFGDYEDLKFPADVARGLLREAIESGDPKRERLLAALVSDGATKETAGTSIVVAPPLCTMLGQGHQHFLRRLTGVGRGHLPKSMQKSKKPPDLNSTDYLARALFSEWRRRDETDSFRWDPNEDRRYALRAVDPSGDPARTEHGANRLAVVGLPLLVSVPTDRRGSAGIATVGFSWGNNRRQRVTWPIWKRRIDLATLVALMQRAELHGEPPVLLPLRSLGVVAAYRAYRLEVGYYANFSAAEAFVS